MNSEKRYTYIDFAKALGMLAVIWGHIHTSGETFVFVYSFDMPLFFFLSGMMYKNEKYDTFGKLIKNRAKTLLIPYVIFSVVTWLIWATYNLAFHNSVDYFYPLLQTVIAQGSNGYMIHNVPLWFVTCLFVVEVMYYFISKLSDIKNLAICLLCAVIGYFMLNNNLDFDFTKFPWNIECAMSAILFYCTGNLFVKHFKISAIPEWVKSNKLGAWISIVVLTVILAVAGIYNGHVSIGSNVLGKSIFLLYLNGFVGTASTLLLASVFEQIGTNNKLIKKPCKLLQWIGKNSFYFMAVHVPIKGFVTVMLSKILKESTGTISRNFAESTAVFIITLIVSALVVIGINVAKKKIIEHKKSLY